MLTSIQNERVKLVHALQNQAKTRRKERKVALEGRRLILDALENGHKADFLLYDPAVINPRDYDVPKSILIEADPSVIRHLSDTEQPQGIVAVFPMPSGKLPSPLTRTLILDDIRDPGNMGTILRTAAAAGIEAAILSPGSVDPYNPKVLRAAMGAQFRIVVAEHGWDAIRDYCRDLPIYLADMVGDVRYDQVDWSQFALIIGSEAHGASAEAEQIAAHTVYIPMQPNAESLNAAIAAGVLLFEARRHLLR
ncbi:MAG: RNA methyltransferase [bacterium]|nr:RNA methyltransferase [bacterium]